MRRVAALALLLLCSEAAACDWITTLGLSYHYHDGLHYDAGAHHNLMNWGLGCEFEHAKSWRSFFGGYDNSYRNTSFYAGGTWAPADLGGGVRAGLMAAAVTGYQDDRRRPSAAAAPVVMWEGRRLGVEGAWLGVPGQHHGVIAARLKLRW